MELGHHVGWWTLSQQFTLHKVHVGGYVREEAMIPLAEVVESWLTGGGTEEAVLGALPVAGKEELTLAALGGQAVLLGGTKLLFALAVHHLGQRLRTDITQLVFGKDEVVAGIEIAVVLHHSGMATGFGQGADAWLLTNPIGQGGVEQLDKVLTHILSHPFIEDGAKEMAPLFGGDGEIGQGDVVLIGRTGQVTSIGMGQDTLYDGRELDEAALYLLKKVVEVEGIIGIEVIHHSQYIPLHPMLIEQSNSPHHLLKRGQSLLVAAVLIMKLLRTINRDTHQPVILFKEAAPLIGEQRTVGLDGVVDGAAGCILLLQLHHPFVKREGTHQRLTAMPGKEHLRHGLRLNVLLNETF